MVGNTLAPAPAEAKAAGASSHTHSPAAGAPAAAPAPKPDPAADAAHHHVPASTKPVNTLCAICGMDVDPDLPTATYQGQTIGFGCPACPPKFRANPDRYGPAYLRNERAK